MSAEQTPDIESVLSAALIDFWCSGLDPEEAEWVREADETAEAVNAHLPWLTAALAPVLAAAVREAEQRALRAAANDLKRLDRIGKTRRDKITDEDWDWYRSHPLVEDQRGPWHLIPPMHKWLRGRADRITEPVSHEAATSGGQGGGDE